MGYEKKKKLYIWWQYYIKSMINSLFHLLKSQPPITREFQLASQCMVVLIECQFTLEHLSLGPQKPKLVHWSKAWKVVSLSLHYRNLSPKPKQLTLDEWKKIVRILHGRLWIMLLGPLGYFFWSTSFEVCSMKIVTTHGSQKFLGTTYIWYFISFHSILKSLNWREFFVASPLTCVFFGPNWFYKRKKMP
jgi:hypothetical protein